MSKHKTVVLIIIAICSALYSCGMYYLFTAVPRTYGLDIASVVLSIPLIVMIVMFFVILFIIEE